MHFDKPPSKFYSFDQAFLFLYSLQVVLQKIKYFQNIKTMSPQQFVFFLKKSYFTLPNMVLVLLTGFLSFPGLFFSISRNSLFATFSLFSSALVFA